MKDNQKVFIRGVEGRGEEVIKMLEERGGKNFDVGGENPDYLYIIDHEGSITVALIDSEIGQIIMDNYIELHLPEKWKDGDVLVDRNNSQIMVLYEFVTDKVGDLFNAYIRLKGVMITSNTLEARERFRLATDQEVKTFYEILHKHHKDWDAEKKQIVDWRWKPKENDTYYYVDGCMIVEDTTFEGRVFDERHYEVGNVFRTREEAEAMAEKIKKLLKGE